MAANARPALFLDRDGVLNQEVNYLHDPRDLVMIEGVGKIIADFNRLGIPVVVVTNQAGIGRGYYDVTAYESVNRAVAERLARDGAVVDAWYFCPHKPDADCACRKPRPGLLERAVADLGLDAERSVLVGDKISDLEAAAAVHVRSILVRTGYGREDEQRLIAGGRAGLCSSAHDSLAHAHAALLALFGFAAPVRGAP
jgi:histidinol-phosphate phosphatase family protein